MDPVEEDAIVTRTTPTVLLAGVKPHVVLNDVLTITINDNATPLAVRAPTLSPIRVATRAIHAVNRPPRPTTVTRNASASRVSSSPRRSNITAPPTTRTRATSRTTRSDNARHAALARMRALRARNPTMPAILAATEALNPTPRAVAQPATIATTRNDHAAPLTAAATVVAVDDDEAAGEDAARR